MLLSSNEVSTYTGLRDFTRYATCNDHFVVALVVQLGFLQKPYFAAVAGAGPHFGSISYRAANDHCVS